MSKRLRVLSIIVMCLFIFSSVCLAATVSGSGKQSRGRPGHNAEINGQLFNLPRAGTISNIDSQGASGFWIEDESGVLIRNFDTINQAMGYTLRAGNYRVIPNIKDGFDYCWINVTFTY